MEELNEHSNPEIIGVMIQLALTIAGAEETSGELIDLRLKKNGRVERGGSRTLTTFIDQLLKRMIGVMTSHPVFQFLRTN